MSILQLISYALVFVVLMMLYYFIWQLRNGQFASENGAPPNFVETLQVVPYEADQFNDDTYAKECPICFEVHDPNPYPTPYPSPICFEAFDAQDGDRSILMTPCQHLYHKSCLEGWMKGNRSCPLCRTDLVVAVEGPTGANAPAGQHDVAGDV